MIRFFFTVTADSNRMPAPLWLDPEWERVLEIGVSSEGGVSTTGISRSIMQLGQYGFGWLGVPP
jgi:hypothetical protein